MSGAHGFVIVVLAFVFSSCASSCALSLAKSMLPAGGSAATYAPSKSTGAAPKNSPPGTAPPAAAVPGPQVAAKGGLASRFFSPYLPLEMFEYDFDMAKGPAKNYTLAFVLSDAKGTLPESIS